MWEEIDLENGGKALRRVFEFRDFSAAFGFMTQVAIESERMNHHPWWSNVWNKVEIRLSTHDEGDSITEKDIKLSEAIDKIAPTPKAT